MQTETFKFKNTKDHWTFSTFLTVGQERKWVQHALDAQATYQDQSLELLGTLTDRMDELVVAQTIEWSYGPLDVDTLRNIPADHYAQVADRMGDLYSPLVVKSIERGLRIYSSLSSQAE